MKKENLYPRKADNSLTEFLKTARAFTLIEIMVAVALLGILVAGIYGVYTSIFNSYISQNQLSEVEQNARAGLEQMVREIRLAGFNSKLSNSTTFQVFKTTGTDFVFQEEVPPVFSGSPVNKKIEYYWSSNANGLYLANTLYRGEEPWSVTGGPGGVQGYRSDGNATTSTPLMTAPTVLQPVASNISNLTITYYDANNGVFTTTSGSNFTTVTRIRISLTARGSLPSPDNIGVNVGGKIYKQVKVEMDLRMRNMGINQANAGTTAPNPPIGLNVLDTGNPCGSLNVSWTANTEPQLAGYAVYYRITGSGAPYNSVTVGKVTSMVLQNLSIGSVYDVTLRAFDTVGNFSNTGSIISSPHTAVNDGITDTQPGILAPAPPTLTGATAGDKAVTLTWTPSSSQGIAGYNIYRSTYAGGVYGSPAILNGATPVNGTTYTDSFAGISAPNCPLTYQNKQPYQYTMASVDCSGTGGTGASSAAKYGDGTSGYSGTAFNTYPTDSVPPGDPTNFTGSAGTNQVLLSWNAPADLDIFGVKVVSNNGLTAPPISNLSYNTYPSLSSYMRQIYLDPSVVTPGQSIGTADNGLTNNTVYTYTAYGFDKCGNFSSGAQSKILAVPCGDATYPGPPSFPTNLFGSSCGAPYLTWNAPTMNGNGTVFAIMPGDVVGFNIYRCSTSPCTRSNAMGWNGAQTPLNQTIQATPNWTDTTAVPGQTYYYAVTALDCVLPTPNESAPAHTAGGVAYVTITPGGLTQDVYFDAGLSTGSNTTTTFNDTTKNWTLNSYQNGTLQITQGSGAGQVRPIMGTSSATSLTIPSTYPWVTPIPDSSSQYQILRPVEGVSSNLSLYPNAHDDVKLYVKNTSAQAIALRSGVDTATITWSNYLGVSGTDLRGVNAYLKQININGQTVWTGTSVTTGTTLTLSFTPAPLTIGSLQRGVPMELFFVDAGNNQSNMKSESISITMTYGILNSDGITYTTCQWNTGGFPVLVAGGPSASLAQTPSSIPSPYVTTTAGTNILLAGAGGAGGGAAGQVVFSNPSPMAAPVGNMISSAILYYCKQSWSAITATAPLPTNSCYIMNTPLNMILNPTNNTAVIAPSSPTILESGDPYRVWYYLKVTDNQGNFSTNPGYNPSSFQAFTFDQYNSFNAPSSTSTLLSAQWFNPSSHTVVVNITAVDYFQLAAPVSGASVSVLLTGSGGTTETLSGTLNGAGAFSGTSVNNFAFQNLTAALTLTNGGFPTKTCSVALLSSDLVAKTSPCP